METESDKINSKSKRYIYNLDGRPSTMCRMITIPLFMYRITTKRFTKGINFFQKAVLRFKNCALITDEDIHAVTGLDPRLIAVIESELRANKLLDSDGTITQNGRDAILEDDGIIIDENSTATGYVFRPVDREELLPTYTEHIEETDTVEAKGINLVGIVDGVKDDGEDRYDISYDIRGNIGHYMSDYVPEVDDFLEAISASVTGVQVDLNEEFYSKKGKLLSIRFFPDSTPECVMVSTYVYLPRYNDETNLYESDWAVMDPFTGKDSQYLKQYLTSIMDSDLNDYIEHAFTDANTIGDRHRVEYMNLRENAINRRLHNDFNDGLDRIDNNLRVYTQSVVGAYCDLLSYSFKNINASDTLISNIQKGLECIFKLDYFNNKQSYDRILWTKYMSDKMDTNYIRYINSNALIAPDKIRKLNCKKPQALKSYLGRYIMHLDKDPTNPLLPLVKGNVEDIIALSDLRNKREHGNTSSEVMLDSMSQENIDYAYSKYKEIVNKYIEIHV